MPETKVFLISSYVSLRIFLCFYSQNVLNNKSCMVLIPLNRVCASKCVRTEHGKVKGDYRKRNKASGRDKGLVRDTKGSSRQ